ALKLMAYVKAKKPDVHISVGGHYAASCYEKILNGISLIDSVNLGEGEKTFLDLCRKINAKEDWRSVLGLAYHDGEEIVCNAMPDLVKNLDELPFPLRDIRGEVSILSISSSRGCYGQCSFCDVNSFYERQPGEKVRVRSAVNVVNEIEMLVEKYHVNKFKFVDDNFLSNTLQRKQWALAIADEIKNRNLKINFLIECRASDIDENTILRLKEAGLSNVFLGIESITPRILRVFNKNISPKENYEAISILKKCSVGMTIGYIL
ncbi:MAG: B12-binding domain-containing radical SAM protein, partial [Ruminiclostridium sp.]